jgi:methionine--tRNA ligase beta chain
MKDGIIYADWQKIDVRLGRIVAASNPEWSNKLIELHVDFGPVIGERTIFTGLRAWYTPEQMQGKQAMFIINLPYKKMGEHESQGMILAVEPTTADGNSAPVVLLFDDIAPAGSPLA